MPNVASQFTDLQLRCAFKKDSKTAVPEKKLKKQVVVAVSSQKQTETAWLHLKWNYRKLAF